MIAGWLTSDSTPPSDSASVNSSSRSQKRFGAVEAALHPHREHAAEAVHLPLRERVVRMRCEAGMDHHLDRRMRLQPFRQRLRVSQCARMRRCSVFRPRRARKLSNGPCTAPTEFCRNATCSASSASSPTTSMPPTMSEWPLRYFVAECMTRSAPCSSGRCSAGEAKVLSTTDQQAALLRDGRDRGDVDDLQQRVGRRFDPDQLRPA